MAANSSSLRFTVEVAADQADQALKAMTLAFNQAGAQARIAMQGIGGASKGAGGLHAKAWPPQLVIATIAASD